ncbi:MAG: hypothetical protein ACRBN8_35335 [Nannocystales bacterium]
MNASKPMCTVLFASSLVAAAGCDLSVYPTTSEYDAQEAARASLDLDAASMPNASEVVDVELTLDTVAMHRLYEDRWVLLSGDEATTTLVAEPRSDAIPDVPMRMQAYDQLSFGITRVRVATAEGWRDADLLVDEVTVDGDFIVDTDVTIALTFDLQAGLQGNANAGYTFEPLVEAAVQAAR